MRLASVQRRLCTIGRASGQSEFMTRLNPVPNPPDGSRRWPDEAPTLGVRDAESAASHQLLELRNALVVPAVLAAVESELGPGSLSRVKADGVLFVVPPDLVKRRTVCHRLGDGVVVVHAMAAEADTTQAASRHTARICVAIPRVS